ncbi:MAG: acetylxylan esterase [Lentisphaeria bacterium]|nr:acetylxylan esterase [Lentisphaeria bacterium]
MYVQKLPWEANYDESQMPAYTLPEVLLCQDGSTVKTAEEWMTKRRGELLQMFKDVMYGERPPLPDRVRYELLSEKRDARGGKAIRREVRIHFEMNNGRTHFIDMLYYLPAKTAGKVPVFVGLTFIGNHVITKEEDVRITGTAGDVDGAPINREHGFQERRFPIDTILERGYALAVVSYHDIFPDRLNGWENSIYKLFFSGEELKRPKGYSSIGAWSWGISRMLDYLETVPEIDASKAAVFGHSRLGKTSLWTGVNDERFKLVCVNDSGCGGAALSRRLYGETLYSMYNHNHIGKYWFTDTLEAKALHPENLPLDQHELIALIAPRAVAVHSATGDQWADPKGEYLSAYYAGPVFRLFGKQPLALEIPPEPEHAVGTDVSYYCRIGKHDLLLSDWEHYMSMADRVFGK